MRDSYLQAFWESAKENKFAEIWNTKFLDKDRSLKATEAGVVAETLSGDYAMYHFHHSAKRHPEYAKCLIQPAFVFSTAGIGFAFPKNSPNKAIFDHALRKMKENGELDRIQKKNKIEEPRCGQSKKGEALGFRKLCLVFVIIVVGISASVVLFVAELIIGRLSKKDRRKLGCFLVVE